MSDELFRAMEPRDRSDWTKIPEALRMVLLKILTGTKNKVSPPALAQTRRTCMRTALFQLQSTLSLPGTMKIRITLPHYQTSLCADSHLIQSMHDLIVKASK